MKIDFKLRLHAVWQTLTEVPGWPDAPRALRIRRVLPIAIPALVFLSLTTWNLAWVQPSIARGRAEYAPVQQLADEVAGLREVTTEEAAATAASRSAEAAKMLLESPGMLAGEMDTLREMAARHGWQATFQALPVPSDPLPEAVAVSFLPVRGRLSPAADNAQPFDTLLTVLEEFSSSTRRIDLTRLLVRADEGGRQSVELYLQLGCRRAP